MIHSITGDIANMLRNLGMLYVSPIHGLKEYVSNAIDAFRNEDLHLKGERLLVRFTLGRRSVAISANAPGMTEREWQRALSSVADSQKRFSEKPQIGIKGIGNFGFMPTGRRAEFFHRASESSKTVKVVLLDGKSDAEITRPLKREDLPHRGTLVKVTELRVMDPTSSKSPIALYRLKRFLAEQFDSFIRDGWLEIEIMIGDRILEKVKAFEIKLPRIAEEYITQFCQGRLDRKCVLTLWFDPSGRGIVRIRHAGVPIVEDIKQCLNGYGLEESVFASGYVFGYLDADFLEPLPTRSGFEEGSEWYALLDVLNRIAPSVEAEVNALKDEAKSAKTDALYTRAIKLARELLTSAEGLSSLEWFSGVVRGRESPPDPPDPEKKLRKPGVRSGVNSNKPGTKGGDDRGKRILLVEEPFPEGPMPHSAFVDGEHVTVRVNILNADYLGPSAPEQKRLYYLARLIQKEVIAFNDKSKRWNEALERSLYSEFILRKSLGL